MLVLYECTGIKTGHLLTSSPGKKTEHFPKETRSYVLNGTQSLSVLGAHYKNCHRRGEQRLKRKWPRKWQDQKERENSHIDQGAYFHRTLWVLKCCRGSRTF